MALPIVKKRLTDLILKAQKADEAGLILLREKILRMVSTVGAKYFVNSTAEVLKNSFQIEGCNDARIPLDELDEKLLSRTDNLPEGHPIRILLDDHKESLGRLKELRFSLGRLNLNEETTSEKMYNIVEKTRDYYGELDSHIRKEEEVLFPMLEKTGMQEHPQNLREEHKKFKGILSELIEILKKAAVDRSYLAVEKIGRIKEEFISDIANHIFRETFIFYPAALEFITDQQKWLSIKEAFNEEVSKMDNNIQSLDLRPMPPFERHEKIFRIWDTLKAGQTLRIINDHDPKPLWYQFEVEYKDKYEWEYEKRGPKDWIVKIKRV